jgi:hypothetical protein
VNFDYRVVATALGHAGQRMAVTNLPVPRTSLPIVPKGRAAAAEQP